MQALVTAAQEARKLRENNLLRQGLVEREFRVTARVRVDHLHSITPIG